MDASESPAGMEGVLGSRTVRVMIAFLVAAAVWGIIHEGTHVIVAAFYGEFAGVAVVDSLPQVVMRTPVKHRGAGLKWALIAGLPSLITVLLGYGMLLARNQIRRVFSGLSEAVLYWTTVALLILDPTNLSLGPLVFGGDAVGVAWGLTVPVVTVQVVAGLVLLVNRELIVRLLFPLYGIETDNPLWKPL